MVFSKVWCASEGTLAAQHLVSSLCGYCVHTTTRCFLCIRLWFGEGGGGQDVLVQQTILLFGQQCKTMLQNYLTMVLKVKLNQKDFTCLEV
jgi:hypothetical protein